MLALLVRPGLIALTVTPRVPRSLDSATVRLCIAALVAPYAAMFTLGINPIVLAMLMILPHCLSAISGANRRLTRTIEVTLLLYIEFHSAGSVSTHGFPEKRPALLTRMSTPSKASSACDTTLSASASVFRSPRANAASAPSARSAFSRGYACPARSEEHTSELQSH